MSVYNIRYIKFFLLFEQDFNRADNVSETKPTVLKLLHGSVCVHDASVSY